MPQRSLAERSIVRGRQPARRRLDPALREIRDELSSIDDAPEPSARRVLAPLARYVAAGHSAAFATRVDDTGPDIDFYFAHGPGIEGWVDDFRAAYRQEPYGYLHCDPIRPAPEQRNRTVSIDAAAFAAAIDAGPKPYRALAAQYRSIIASHHLRVLVCEGPLLLACVVAVRRQPFGDGDVTRMQRLVPALIERFGLDVRLGLDGATRPALAAALERLGAPALVVRERGGVVHANAAGRAWYDLGESLPEACGGACPRDPGWTVARVVSRGLPSYRLLVRRDEAAREPAALARLASRWGLTPTEVHILRSLARGEPNKGIAAELGCAESSVEAHITKILERAGCDTRSAVAARVWEAA